MKYMFDQCTDELKLKTKTPYKNYNEIAFYELQFRY